MDIDKNMEIKKKSPKNTDIHKYLEKEGQKRMKKNNFFKDLDEIMNDEQFRGFMDKYSRQWGELETILMYVKLYDTIEKEYMNKYNKPISRKVIIGLIMEMMSNGETRSVIARSYNDFKNKTEDFSKYFLENMSEKRLLEIGD